MHPIATFTAEHNGTTVRATTYSARPGLVVVPASGSGLASDARTLVNVRELIEAAARRSGVEIPRCHVVIEVLAVNAGRQWTTDLGNASADALREVAA